jgi:hypothetical protein
MDYLYERLNPLRMAGSKAGLKLTMVPGTGKPACPAGRSTSPACACGKGNKHTLRIKQSNFENMGEMYHIIYICANLSLFRMLAIDDILNHGLDFFAEIFV